MYNTIITNRAKFLLVFLLENKAITTQQYRTAKGMLYSDSVSRKQAVEYIQGEMYRLYPTDKERFSFSIVYGNSVYGWGFVKSLC